MSSPSASIGLIPLASSLITNIEPVPNYVWPGIALLVGLLIYTSKRPINPYDKIPAIGRTGFVTSYIDAILLLGRAKTMVQEGYDKYKHGIFRVPELHRWHVIVSGEQYVEEIRKAPDDVLSFDAANNDLIAGDYTVGPNVMSDMYHVRVTNIHLNRNLSALFPEIHDELQNALENYIPATEDWTRVKALDTVMAIFSRTSNRTFVGLPICRDPEYAKLNIRFTVDIMVTAQIINLFPEILRPFVGRLFPFVGRAIQTALKHLKPVIEERQYKIDAYGPEYPDKPNDLLSWLMDHARGEQRSTRNLTLRVLFLNFAAIHTTSMSFTQALYYLATRPEYIQPIREEIETIIAEDGWSRDALSRMRKLDSFLKESARLQPLGALSLFRKVLKDFTFSDGTRVPKGGVVSAAMAARHYDEEIWPDAATFDGFRFCEGEGGGGGVKNQMVATSPNYLSFGFGRHACPGRFLASQEQKMLMAHMVLSYDIKMENEGVRPETRWHAFACVPDPKAEVLFRKRRV